ncbi:MAG: efflux RND transporter permease subunit, partial [Sideroxyarcus sp.]|nr:efflux RND transporter permease subunit [Sideroxyarcus sp.]
RSVQEYRDLLISWRDGSPLRLGDLATVENGAEDRFLAAWANSQPAVLINIQRQPGANVIDVADSVQALLPQLTATLPAAVNVAMLSDRTHSIRTSIRDVQKELIFAIFLVVAVTFVFLRSVPATIIPSLAVPLSLVGTFAVMYFLDFSINNLTLMALTIATGFVVDDAIVMLENVARHREMGESPMQAALKGAGEIGFTLVSLTISLIAVLIPLLFMGDLVGRLFQEFAITLAVAIGISLLVSLTLTPMMCARMLKHAPVHNDAEPDFMERLIASYGRGLDKVLQHQTAAMLVMIGTVVMTAGLYLAVPKGFFPIQDSGVIQAVTEAPQDTSFGAMAEKQQALAEVILQDPDVEGLSSFIGVDGSNITLNSGRLLINLKSHNERDTSASEIINRLREQIKGVTGITAWFQPVQELSIEDRVSRTQYQFSLTTPDSALLDEWVP